MIASVEESPDLREAWMLLFQGDLKQAADRFQTRLAATDEAAAASGLLLCAAVMGAEDAVGALLTDRWDRRQDAALVLWRAAWICAANGSAKGLAHLKTALSRFPNEGREHAAPYYAAGHLAMLGGEEEAAIAHFLAAKRGFDSNPEWFLRAQDQTLANVFVQTRHMLTPERVAALAEGIGPAPGFASTEDDAPCIAIAADGGYLRRFGADFAASLDRTNPGATLHVLAVDTDPADTADLAKAAPSLFIRTRHETSGFPGVNRPAVYAGWRFLAMQRLLAENRRPVLVLDIDLLVRAPLTPLFQAMEGADFGCWFRPDGGPGGIVRAGAAAFSPTGEAWRMAALTGAYIRARFAEETENLWFVDQAALWRAAHWAKKNRPGFSLSDFSTAGSFSDFFDLVRDEDIKKR